MRLTSTFFFALYAVTCITGCAQKTSLHIPLAIESKTKMNLNNKYKFDNNIQILFKEISSGDKLNTIYSQGANYEDSNMNKIADDLDTGFFNPASTIKVAIALVTLEKLATEKLNLSTQYKDLQSNEWRKVKEDMIKMLVISDNDATNRLILWIGFTELNNGIKKLNIKGMEINRLMLDKGTLVNSPIHMVKNANKIIYQKSQIANINPSCYEINKKVGNCATAESLILSMSLAAGGSSDSFQKTDSNKLYVDNQIWLSNILSKKPKELGYNYESNYCRFIDGFVLPNTFQTIDLILSKCGVALFSNTFSDLSFFKMNNGRKYLLLIVKKYSIIPSGKSIVKDFRAIAGQLLQNVDK